MCENYFNRKSVKTVNRVVTLKLSPKNLVSIKFRTAYLMDLQIINECSKLPPLAIWHIKKSLQWIPPLDLVGIDHIRLVDEVTEINTGSPKKDKELHDEMSKPAGFYCKGENSPAFIELIIKNLYYPIPFFANFSPLPTLRIAKILAHEVGHHLIRTRGYVFLHDEKYPAYEKKPEFEEEMADRYALEIVRKMKKKLTYKIGTYLMDSLSDYHYGVAMAAWNDKDYKSSAAHWEKSLILNSERQESLEWYWHSRKKIEDSKKSLD